MKTLLVGAGLKVPENMKKLGLISISVGMVSRKVVSCLLFWRDDTCLCIKVFDIIHRIPLGLSSGPFSGHIDCDVRCLTLVPETQNRGIK